MGLVRILASCLIVVQLAFYLGVSYLINISGKHWIFIIAGAVVILIAIWN